MIKIAKDFSKDPVQLKLRQEKTSWNHDVSSFIDNLINFKKTMNGSASKIYMQKSKITEPMPTEAKSFLIKLINDFNDLSKRGQILIQNQSDYSKNRRKKQVSKSPDLTSKLSLPLVASNEYNLLKESSNILSRFWARLKNPAIGSSPAARRRKYRMSMLSAATDLWKNFDKYQDIIVGSSPESIVESYHLLNKIENQLGFIETSYDSYSSNMQKAPELDVQNPVIPVIDEKDSIKENSVEESAIIKSPILLEAENAIIDFRNFITNFLDFNTKEFNKIVIQFSNSPDEDKLILAPNIVSEYKKILNQVNKANNTNELTLKAIFEQKNKKGVLTPESDESDVLDANIFTRYYGKLKHTLNPLDKTSALRLDMYKLADICKKDTDRIMNSLEDTLADKKIVRDIEKIKLNIKKLNSYYSSLLSITKGVGFDNTFIKLLEQKNMFENSPNLSKTEKDNLQNLMKQRYLRNLTNKYNKTL